MTENEIANKLKSSKWIIILSELCVGLCALCGKTIVTRTVT